MPLLAPVVIAIGMKRQEIEKIPELDEIEAVACAVQNMHLHRGRHSVWAVSGPPTSLRSARRCAASSDWGRRIERWDFSTWDIPRASGRTGTRQPVAEKVSWERS